MNEDVPLTSAGVARRIAAMLYDTLLLSAVLFFATALLLPLTGGEALAPGNLLYFTYLLAVSFLYFGWFWTHGGQTLGLKAWKLKACPANGGEMTWRDSVMRYSSSLLSLAPLALGFVWAFFDRDKLMWHDRLSRTRLMRVHQ